MKVFIDNIFRGKDAGLRARVRGHHFQAFVLYILQTIRTRAIEKIA